MAEQFDPYLKWFGIPPEDQPANHYRLLSIPLFIDDPDVIANAADRQMMMLRSFQTGERANLSQKLLNEVSRAKACLLNPQSKAAYDASLRPAPPLNDQRPEQPAELLPESTAQFLARPDPLPAAEQVLPSAVSGSDSDPLEGLQFEPRPSVNIRPTRPQGARAAKGLSTKRGQPQRIAARRRSTTLRGRVHPAWYAAGAGLIVVVVVTLLMISGGGRSRDAGDVRVAENRPGIASPVPVDLASASRSTDPPAIQSLHPKSKDPKTGQDDVRRPTGPPIDDTQPPPAPIPSGSDALLRAAEEAVERGDFSAARTALMKILGDPSAPEHDRARKLWGELKMVNSDQWALQKLSQLDDQTFASFSKGDEEFQLPGLSAGLVARARQTLKRNLPEAQRRRQFKAEPPLVPLPTGTPVAVPPKTITNSIGMTLALIPAGEFMMGSPPSENGHQGNETQHRVRITKPFYTGVYDVTQAEYQRVAGSNPSWFSASGGGKDKVAGQSKSRFPVEQVSWGDAQEFCRKLSRKEGKTYRLPTEAEWEYACRAGTTTPFTFGERLNGSEANCAVNEPNGTMSKGAYLQRTTTVGSYRPNAFGLYDMHGNVWQWCSDWYGADYYATSPVDDPSGPVAGSIRVLRGGSWGADAILCRAARRGSGMPSFRNNHVGFRVVREP